MIDHIFLGAKVQLRRAVSFGLFFLTSLAFGVEPASLASLRSQAVAAFQHGQLTEAEADCRRLVSL